MKSLQNGVNEGVYVEMFLLYIRMFDVPVKDVERC